METLLTAVIVMSGIGIIAAVVLFIVAKKFYVYEDPRIDMIESLLPGANCGGCSKKGCRDFATACTKATSLEGFLCPSCNQATMIKIANIVGLAPVESIARIAILKCNGTCENRSKTSNYVGGRKCAIEATLFSGETECIYGCLGCGDCIEACPYGALSMNRQTGMPIVDATKCVGCGKCVRACPRSLFELADKRNNKLVYVGCMNKDKGALAMKVCKTSCIGCGKCLRTCRHDAITINENLAYIDSKKCIGCEECKAACPRNSIISIPL